MRWWTAVVDRSYPVWSASIVLVLGGLAAAIAVAAGWAQAPKARLLMIAATFLAAFAAAWAQLRLTARNQQPTSYRRPWNIPSPIGSFTGRSVELAVLRSHLRRRSADGMVPTVVLTGIPGVGKTQLARAYAHRSRRQCRLGWWLPAETTMTIDGPLRALAQRLGLDSNGPLDTLSEEVNQALASRRRWLLVFDNADQPAQLATFLPRHGRGQVLITSRHDRWQQLAEPLSVNLLPADDAVRVLLARTAKHEPEAARELVEALHYLPLAVEQAAAYISSQPDLSIAGYLELFRTHEQQLLDRGTPLHYQEGFTVAAVVAIALQQLGKTRAAGQLLRLSAFLASDQLPLRLLLSRPNGLPRPLADAAGDEITRRDAEEMLYRLGLLTGDAQGTAQFHRLLQDAVRLYLPAREQRAWVQHAVELLAELLAANVDLSVADADLSIDPERWILLLPHVETALGHALTLGLTFPALANLATATGLYFRGRQEFSVARDRHEQALAVRRRLYGGHDHPHIASSLMYLGDTLDELAELRPARDYFQQALAMRRRLYGDGDSLQVANSLNNLGGVLRRLGDLAAALECHQQALAMRRRLYGDGDHPYIAMSLNNLGNVLYEIGDLHAARDHYEEALAMRRRLYGGDDHRYLASSLNNLGNISYELWELRPARDYFEQAIAMYRRLYGNSDLPSVALSLNGLGQVLEGLGELPAAIESYSESLAVRLRLYGDSDHPDIASSLENLGNVLRKFGDLPIALDSHERALAMRRRLYGEDDHPDVAMSQGNLGNVLYEIGDSHAARDHYEQALAMQQRLYGGGGHPALASSLSNLGNVLNDLGDLHAARDHYEQALAMRRRLYGGRDHLDTANSLKSLATVVRKLGDRRTAATLEAEANAMEQRLFEEQFPIPPGLKDLGPTP